MAVYFPEKNVMYIHFPKTGGCTFYGMLSNLDINYVNVGYQHDRIDNIGKHYWNLKPKVIVFSREKESWFRSYHNWRLKNPEGHTLPGYEDLWHPLWVLEDLFDRDYNTFRETIAKRHPRYYENLCEMYYNHPTFDMNIFAFETITIGYFALFEMIGYPQTMLWIKNFPIQNKGK